MTDEQLDALKLRIRKTGLSFKDISRRIYIPYGTLSNYLNGFNPMPEHVLIDIENVLKKEEG